MTDAALDRTCGTSTDRDAATGLRRIDHLAQLEDWLARQLCHYRHLAEKDPQRVAWILRGEHCGRGPDCEPLLKDVEPIAVIGAHVLLEARERYERNFDAGHGPADDEEDRG